MRPERSVAREYLDSPITHTGSEIRADLVPAS